MYLFFDTETTNLPDNKMPPSWEGQPHICQLGAILTDRNGLVKAEVNLLVKPDGWVVPQAATDIHGITQATAEQYGLSLKGILTIFDRLSRMAEVIVAHNLKFDLFLLEVAAIRACAGINIPREIFCTMERSTNILKIPPTAKMTACGMTKYKNPNLQEAYRHFFGRDFEGAHDAMADVRACRDVFFALKKLEVTGAAA